MGNGSVECRDSSWCFFDSYPRKKNQNLFEVKDIQISGLPVEALRVRIEKEAGLRQLVYEIDNENMTEVLAGLRYRFGSPVGANVDIEGGSPE